MLEQPLEEPLNATNFEQSIEINAENEQEAQVETIYRVTVKLGIDVGDLFRSFEEFQTKLHESARTNFVRFHKRDSRTIEAARRKIKDRHLNPALKFYQLRYSCFFSQRNRPKGTGKRNRRSLKGEVEFGCPAQIALRATENGEFLEVYSMQEEHNHPVSESHFQMLMPKKRAASLFDGNCDSEAEFDEEDKYRTVLKKCRFIARIASNASTSRIDDIIKNLDDYIYYLKYTLCKEEDGMTKEDREEEQVELEEEQVKNEFMDTGTQDISEDIQIIVENDGVVDPLGS